MVRRREFDRIWDDAVDVGLENVGFLEAAWRSEHEGFRAAADEVHKLALAKHILDDYRPPE